MIEVNGKKYDKLHMMYIIQVSDERAADTSYDIMPEANTLDDTIREAWRKWKDLPANGHRKDFCSVEVTRHIVEENEVGILQYFDHDNCDDEELSLFAEKFDADNEGLYYISSTMGKEMDELCELISDWTKGEALDEDVSNLSEDEFLARLKEKRVVSEDIIDEYKKYLQ